MVKNTVHVFPTKEILTLDFDENGSVRELKVELEEEYKMKKGTYYIEMNDLVMSDDMILKRNGVIRDSNLNVIRNDYVKIKVEAKKWGEESKIIQKYVLISDFKVIKADENRLIKV